MTSTVSIRTGLSILLNRLLLSCPVLARFRRFSALIHPKLIPCLSFPLLVMKRGKCQTPVMAKLEIDIDKLTPEERLDLIEELWDSLSSDPAKIPLTNAQAKEIDRRLAEMDQDETLGIPWETVLARIRERK